MMSAGENNADASVYQQTMAMIRNYRLSEAEAIIQAILASDPAAEVAGFQLGLIRQVQGEIQEAVDLQRRVLALRPDFTAARQQLGKLNEMAAAIEAFEPRDDAVYTYYFDQQNNWGDVLNKVLIEHLSGKEVVWAPPFDYRFPVKHMVIGSIIHSADANTVVWGAGAISARVVTPVRPSRVCAVRGPLTRESLISRGIDCPEIYGDPALLYPRFYNPDIRQEHDLGIVAHYVDQQHPWLARMASEGVKIIDVRGGVNQVVDDIKSCRCIASSSLHGLIAADAYGIPSVWIELSDKVIGEGFKFRDYFQSVNRMLQVPVRIDGSTQPSQVQARVSEPVIDIDLDLLLESCPFSGASLSS